MLAHQNRLDHTVSLNKSPKATYSSSTDQTLVSSGHMLETSKYSASVNSHSHLSQVEATKIISTKKNSDQATVASQPKSSNAHPSETKLPNGEDLEYPDLGLNQQSDNSHENSKFLTKSSAPRFQMTSADILTPEMPTEISSKSSSVEKDKSFSPKPREIVHLPKAEDLDYPDLGPQVQNSSPDQEKEKDKIDQPLLF